MHIGEKILSSIEDALSSSSKYSICMDSEDRRLLTQPLPLTETGKIDKDQYEIRQQNSLNLITKILDNNDKAYIVKYLGHLAALEPKIQALQPWVRDHVIHAVNTFILGVYIINKVEFPPTIKSRFDFSFMWKLCGPTHDLAYPIEIAYNVQVDIIKEMNKFLDGLGSISPRIDLETYPKGLNLLCDNKSDANQIIQERLKEWSLDINIKDYYNWLKSKNKTDHGVVGALVQLKVIDALYFAKNPQNLNEDIMVNGLSVNRENFDLDIVSACSALFVHNICHDYAGFKQKISFQKAPLAFLLYLCDTFQEWDRYAENKPVYSGVDFDINCTVDSISLTVPKELEDKIITSLKQRLSGLSVFVNGRAAVIK